MSPAPAPDTATTFGVPAISHPLVLTPRFWKKLTRSLNGFRGRRSVSAPMGLTLGSHEVTEDGKRIHE
jgi:hypothetical protein